MVRLAESGDDPIARTAIRITGIVQGVGFRPFVYRLANELGLTGWVANGPAGVQIEAQSTGERLAHFARRLQNEAPPLAVIATLDRQALPERDDEEEFSIRATGQTGDQGAQIPPDTALCPDCFRELFDPADRRYRYPFITCTNCGPRYSIVTGLPYDRPATTMAGFPLCAACAAEYTDPLDRRFHAQPLACPQCGPRLQLVGSDGTTPVEGDEALRQAAARLAAGDIVAVKGIGGFHLAVDAGNAEAVARLRQRKQRDEKPFAVMVPDLAAARRFAVLDGLEERLLASPEAPIVIARRRPDAGLAPLIAPDNGWLGLMLPYTPLHHLLFAAPQPDNTTTSDSGAYPGGAEKLAQAHRPVRRGGFDETDAKTRQTRAAFQALVMTSGNLSDEPIACENGDALSRLAGIADWFLIHDRPIHVRQDDSVLRVFQGKPLFYRRARGYVPRPIHLPFTAPPLLACGAELKGAACLANGTEAFLSQHVGDLQNAATCDSFRPIIDHLARLFRITPELVAGDRHPDYLSSVLAAELANAHGVPFVPVQHHHAHMAACMAENRLDGDVIGVVFDGTGLGEDGTVWGGEFLVGGYARFERVAGLRPVPLPGGDAAVREPWRMALSWLWQEYGDAAFELPIAAARQLPPAERAIFGAMIARGLNSPLTSSCGRLFDAAAALLDVRQKVSYDGQAAIELEALAESAHDDNDALLPYRLDEPEDGPMRLDFAPLFPALLDKIAAGGSPNTAALAFHCTLARATVDACLHIASLYRLNRVVLSGGVFQNRLLSEMIYSGLAEHRLQVFCHRLTPPNDGCIALGQAAVAAYTTRR